ncbi:DNA polymerase III subunit delta [Methyloraptor flagellatus]|jgi:DNA polymerase-3 subunit delta|uniref:DNA polymerase III subunit delta n=1 Tax=Methyloraptor flagellatus TaxID=3162530 RepID=A0AAU7XB33_9HYPH
MAALKPSEVDAFLKKPFDRVSLVLIYGQDEGLIAERAAKLIKAATAGADDPFSLVKLGSSEVSSDPARLIDEARTVSLFGNRRVVWVRDDGARYNVGPALEPLFDTPEQGSLVVVEAGDLKKGTGLRKRFEDHPAAAAIACYVDNAADLARLIEEETRLAGLTIDADARELLESQLGGDRLASRGEVRKLCLYCHGRGRITADDVTAVVGDVSTYQVSALIDAIAGGNPTETDRLVSGLEGAGTSPAGAGTAVIRHFQMLDRARADVDSGRTIPDVIARMQPPVYDKRKPIMTRQLTLWTAKRLQRALQLLDEAMLRSRTTPQLATAVLNDAFLQIARAARAADRR